MYILTKRYYRTKLIHIFFELPYSNIRKYSFFFFLILSEIQSQICLNRTYTEVVFFSLLFYFKMRKSISVKLRKDLEKSKRKSYLIFLIIPKFKKFLIFPIFIQIKHKVVRLINIQSE